MHILRKILLYLLFIFIVVGCSVCLWIHFQGYTTKKLAICERDFYYSSGGHIYLFKSSKHIDMNAGTKKGNNLSTDIVPFIFIDGTLFYWSADDYSIAARHKNKTKWYRIPNGMIINGESVKRLAFADNKVFMNLKNASGGMCGVVVLDTQTGYFSRDWKNMSVRSCLIKGKWSVARVNNNSLLTVSPGKYKPGPIKLPASLDWDYNFKNGDVYWIDRNYLAWKLSGSGIKTKLSTPLLRNANSVIWQNTSDEIWLPLGVTMSSGNGVAIYAADGKLSWMKIDELHPMYDYVQQSVSLMSGSKVSVNR